EDGIRDRNVTGVQTCALPILLMRSDLMDVPNAQNKFCLIFRIVDLLNSTAVGTSIKSLLINIMSADSMATSVPEPIAIPISACRSEERREGNDRSTSCAWQHA